MYPVSRCQLFCLCLHCLKANCPYGFKFGETLQTNCIRCINLGSGPRLDCDYFKPKRVQKLYKLRYRSKRKDKQLELLKKICDKLGVTYRV